MSKNIDMGSWFFNQNFNGVSDEFFDDPLKFIDFPMEPLEEDNGVVEEDWDAKFRSLELPPPDALASLSSTFCTQGCSETKRVLSDISASCDETSQLNQLPNILEDTTSRSSLHQNNSSFSKESCVFQTPSPVSVLESNSSCSAVGHHLPFDPKIVVPVKRRSKRTRTSTSKPWSERAQPSSSDLLFAFNMGTQFSQIVMKPSRRREKKRKRLSVLSGAKEIEELPPQQSEGTRKCTHCQTTHTPQWREGPKGPKTLCNACGVRYRSGRLFPEYRPVASPTFIPALHSNSHKKVTEMRKRGSTHGAFRANTDTSPSPLQENSVS